MTGTLHVILTEYGCINMTYKIYVTMAILRVINNIMESYNCILCSVAMAKIYHHYGIISCLIVLIIHNKVVLSVY